MGRGTSGNRESREDLIQVIEAFIEYQQKIPLDERDEAWIHHYVMAIIDLRICQRILG